jgi:hypothetical protein
MAKKCAVRALIRLLRDTSGSPQACVGHASSMGHSLGQESLRVPERCRDNYRLLAFNLYQLRNRSHVRVRFLEECRR